MFDLKYLILFILIGVLIYLIYSFFPYHSKQLDKTKTAIVEDIEIIIDDINTKLDNIYNLVDSKINICNNRINELYSLQNKINEITKMNSQSIINQINQYDDVNDDYNTYDNSEKNQIFNSLENSIKQKSNEKCFVKSSDIINKEKFYSPENSESLKSINKSDISNLNKFKLEINDDKNTSHSAVLEFSSNEIKSIIDKDTPKANCAFNILNESTNIFKNLKNKKNYNTNNLIILSDNKLSTSPKSPTNSKSSTNSRSSTSVKSNNSNSNNSQLKNYSNKNLIILSDNKSTISIKSDNSSSKLIFN